MSLIVQYNQTQDAIRELQAKIAQLEADERFQREREFEGKLRSLLETYGKSLRDIIAIIDPAASAPRVADREKQTRQRRLKRYHNPHTSEVIETKGGNHKQLKQWKTEHGAEVVEGWASFA